MISSWYNTLKQKRLYRAFLAHRVWMAQKIIPAHIFYCFPLGTVMFVWIFLPLAVVLLPLGILISKPDIAIFVLSFIELAILITIGPIAGRCFLDFFRGYFAGFGVVFGRKRLAHTFIKDTQSELDEWDRLNA